MKQMSSFFARALAAMTLVLMALAPTHTLAAEPQGVMVQSVTRGNLVLTRSINSNNVLTQSSCVVQVTGDLTEQRCTSESVALADEAAGALRDQMRMEAARNVAEAHAAMRSMSSSASSGMSSSTRDLRSFDSSAKVSLDRTVGTSRQLGSSASSTKLVKD